MSVVIQVESGDGQRAVTIRSPLQVSTHWWFAQSQGVQIEYSPRNNSYNCEGFVLSNWNMFPLLSLSFIFPSLTVSHYRLSEIPIPLNSCIGVESLWNK